MKQNVPAAVGVAIAVIVGLMVVFFGWRKVSGADNDVTQETIKRYQGISNERFGGNSGGPGPGQMTHGVPPAGSSNNPPPTTAGAPR